MQTIFTSIWQRPLLNCLSLSLSKWPGFRSVWNGSCANYRHQSCKAPPPDAPLHPLLHLDLKFCKHFAWEETVWKFLHSWICTNHHKQLEKVGRKLVLSKFQLTSWSMNQTKFITDFSSCSLAGLCHHHIWLPHPYVCLCILDITLGAYQHVAQCLYV